METERVVLDLTDVEREAVNHELSEPYGQDIRIGVLGKLRAALEQGQVEAVEYRVAWEDRDGETRYSTATKARAQAETAVENVLKKRWGSNVRIQTASTFTGPWIEGAEWAGATLDDPDRQFERHWQEQIAQPGEGEQQ